MAGTCRSFHVTTVPSARSEYQDPLKQNKCRESRDKGYLV